MENLSPNRDDAYFPAGIHEEILTRFAKIKDLNVIARTSVTVECKEDCESLRRQIKRLNKDISYLKRREHQHRQVDAEKSEIRNFLAGVQLLMLRLLQGHVPFRVIAENLACELDQDELRKLYDTALKQPTYLGRRALTIIFYLYGIDNRTTREFLYISRNTVKRYIQKFQDYGVDSFLDTR